MPIAPHPYRIDDRDHVGFLAVPDGDAGPRPGVLVFPEAFGVVEHARAKASQLAQLGYVALAVDLYGGGQTFTELEPARAATAVLRANRREWRKRARAGYDTLAAHPAVDGARLAAIGFCFGGASAIELARAGAPLAAVATFHAAITLRMADDPPFRSSVLICVGAADPLIPADTVHALCRELDQGGADWQVHTYGATVHSFTNPASTALGRPDTFGYAPAADRRSWAALEQLLREALT